MCKDWMQRIPKRVYAVNVQNSTAKDSVINQVTKNALRNLVLLVLVAPQRK